MSVLVSDLVAAIRLYSGLRNNPNISDDQIAGFASDAYAELRDIFAISFQRWSKKLKDFSLAGGNGGNTLDLSTVTDLEMVQGLDRNLGGGLKETVDEVGSFTQRNTFGPYPGIGGRRYMLDGDTLYVLPPQLAAGDYTLWYTPQAEGLSLLQDVRTITHDAGDKAWLAGFDILQFLNGDFSSADVGRFIVVSNSGLPGIDGTFEITQVNSPTVIVVPGIGTGTETALPSGTLAKIIGQPAGTIGAVPQIFTPWALFLKIHASIAIRTLRRQPTEDLERKLQVERTRAVNMAKQRSQGVQQAPITRTRRWPFGGFGFGG